MDETGKTDPDYNHVVSFIFVSLILFLQDLTRGHLVTSLKLY